MLNSKTRTRTRKMNLKFKKRLYSYSNPRKAQQMAYKYLGKSGLGGNY